ncbi:MAG: hypothetical protein DWQ10_03320 [Calditrichaeota bacterium]|nr:MAG: hypothetical protein DWQ10_03320 [Calditrichota bacterium]
MLSFFNEKLCDDHTMNRHSVMLLDRIHLRILPKICGISGLILFPLFFVLAFIFSHSLVAEEFPNKPITIIVHSKPGSAIDITSRQLANIARKYTDTPLLVENKTGGSGIIAMRHVLNKKTDGYTILATTKSFISTVQLSSGGVDLDAFRFFACMVVDPEALITNRHAKVQTLDQIIADAKAKDGKQRWLGPLVGGVDHLMAVQTWDKLGIKGEWIPYEGGSDAVAALMGQHGVVYVGNPVDTKGRPDLMLAAVAAPERLPEFPDVPTFLEKGYDISDEVLWRGYAVKRGTPSKVMNFLSDLFEKISADPEWIKFISATSAHPVFFAEDEFSKRVKENQIQARKYLVMANVLQQDQVKTKRNSFVPLIALALFILIVALGSVFKREWINGETVIATFIFCLSIFLYDMTLDFPSGKLGQTAGPAAMPRLWLYGLILFSVLLILTVIRASKKEKTLVDRSVNKPLGVIALMVGYLFILDTLGYYFSTLIFLIAGSYFISYRKHAVIISAAAGFVALSWLIFYKILQVPLPMGRLFE